MIGYGEISGHTHRIVSFQAEVFTGSGGIRYLDAKEDVKVEHEEHGTIELPKGTYEIRQQRELSENEVSMPVAD